ncbi:MAG TPA: class I SAM-dependent methyltransferase [Kofleriaceae bacterium]|nr:class I SAM-dependent methyltransferase [Kofleriaceae bacterium]
MPAVSRLARAVYRTQHLSFLVNATVLQEAGRILAGDQRPRPSRAAIALVRRRVKELLDRDLANVALGLYPRELLFQIPTRHYVRALPRLARDVPRVIRRRRAGAYQDIPDVDPARFPPYYRRNFHWQTDGYLSEHSAEVYDLGVEVLFRGMADVMRRQVIPPITRFLEREQRPAARTRLLDLACGTGRTLRQLATAHPAMRFHGVDLSPYYVQAARRLLADVAEATLAVENAEQLPYADGTFDVVTSVYLFHELPRNARRRVVAEAFRVLRPGGLLVLEDSAQPADSPELAGVLADFPRDFHEPFYRDYLEDDLAALVAEAGFAVDDVEPHLVAKVVVAHRPPAPSR